MLFRVDGKEYGGESALEIVQSISCRTWGNGSVGCTPRGLAGATASRLTV